MKKLATYLFVGYCIYIAATELGPYAECKHIADVLEDIDRATVLSMKWGLSDVLTCTFSSPEKRENWLKNAELFRWNATQVPQLRRR